MTLVRPVTRSLSSALVLSLLGATVTQTLEQQVDEILETEAVSGDAVAQYNQQDLTSMFVETDGSGGNPSVGDSVGFIADTARFEGKTFDQFVSGQTELVANGDFASDLTGWTLTTGEGASQTQESGRLRLQAGTSRGRTSQGISTTIGETYRVSVEKYVGTATSLQNGQVKIDNSAGFGSIVNNNDNTNEVSFVFTATATTTYITLQLEEASDYFEFDNVSIKHIPGYHLIAASDAARPVLLDSFDQSGAALTDNGGRGEELVSNGHFDSDVSGWASGRSAVLTWQSGAMRVANSPSQSSGIADWALTTEVGSTYAFTATMTAVGGSASLGRVNVRTAAGLTGTALFNDDSVSPGETISGTFRAIGTTTYMVVGVFGGSIDGYCDFDNISVKRVLTAFDERGGELVDYSGATLSAESSVSGDLITVDGDGTVNLDTFTTSVVANQTYEVEVTDVTEIVPASSSFQVRAKSSGGGSDFSAVALNNSASVGKILWTPTTSGNLQLRWYDVNGGGRISCRISVKRVLYPNLVTNGTFDTDTDWTKDSNWSISGGAASADGLAAGNIQQPGILTAYRHHRLMLYVSAISGTLRVRFGSGGTNDASITTTGWHVLYLDTFDGQTNLVFRQNAGETCTIDNVIVQEVPSSIERIYFLSTDGSDDQIEADIPPATRNLLSYTEDFSNAAWNKVAVTAGAHDADGFALVTADGSNQQHYVQNNGNWPTSATGTVSFEVKPGTANFVHVLCTGDNRYAQFDMSDGSLVHSSGITSSSATAITGGWRITVTIVTTGSGRLLRLYPLDAANNTAGPSEASTASASFGKIQLEEGSTATDYQHVAQSGIMPETTIVMAVRTSDTSGQILNSDATARYLLVFTDSSAGTVLSPSSGTPSYRLDGVAFAPSTRDDAHTGLADDNWHVVTIQSADLSAWAKVVLGFYDTSSSLNTAMDIAYGPVILPDPSAEDLATIEQAAAAACGVTLA